MRCNIAERENQILEWDYKIEVLILLYKKTSKNALSDQWLETDMNDICVYLVDLNFA